MAALPPAACHVDCCYIDAATQPPASKNNSLALLPLLLF